MTDADLRSALGASILDDADHDPLTVVRRAAEAEVEVRDLLREAVGSARGAGHSWADIGGALGMSRQAAQQRFGTSSGASEQPPDGHRWLGPVTALDEMAELDLAGSAGWRTVDCAPFRHLVRRTSTQWEHRRTTWPGLTRRLREQGWEVGARAFPWVYLVRDTGLPAPPAR